MTPDVPLSRLLKEFFGFSEFRPLQEEIIRSALEGKDVFALLPTGGGKSLCFQLPALARPGLTVVVSPLIALMKDQVDALQASGIAATFLNSSISPEESRTRLRGLHQGEYRLLYVAPERLMLSGFLADLARWNVRLLAIDEAHCISEWGHDFRPEYRQIAQLRQLLPRVPIMALTATATERVRQDILTQLSLRSPRCFVASFDRPNLTYRVLAKQESLEQITRFIRERPRESGIIYCQSRKSAESVAGKLNQARVSARPYHAGMTAEERSENQELFLQDKVRVICATIAFGMGINKPNVRFVIHYDLPKNLEGYYQETGRAGRDGLPSECLLFFSAGDMVKHMRFIDEKSDPQERELAQQQLHRVVHYAESPTCRRRELLSYFGEDYPDANCGACDNCLAPRETYDGTLSSQKFLSCVYRLRQQSGFDFGMNQVAEVLTGAETESVRKWNHHGLSTYGIGKEHTRAEWKVLGRELIRLGYVAQATERYNVLSLTPRGMEVLKKRETIQLTRAVGATTQEIPRVGAIVCDEALFERLVSWRERTAAERKLHPHTLFSDVTLRLLARDYPETEAALAGISGMSDKKLREFGGALREEIAAHLKENPRQTFGAKAMAALTKIRRPAKSGDEEPYDSALFELLREARKKIAKDLSRPAYMVLHDSALREITRQLPLTMDDLASVSGVGPNRARQCEPLLEIIREHVRNA